MTTLKRTRAQSRELNAYEYTWCRTFGHDWEEWHSDHQPEFGYYESVYCPRCTTERLFTIGYNGEVIARRYIYPEGYKLTFKISASDLRRQMRKDGWWRESSKNITAKAKTSKRRLVAVN